ncbi:unnamed protein product [Clonostachys rosea]|uniref:G domain-containing protein n=1 Tax=Bionectria ochroleuca TaxID=29856 RepID=A0ABY6UZS7_BIOOC|nr:unnamed protein product [Clonostachys rosea]
MALVHAGPVHSRKIPSRCITAMSDDGSEDFYDAPTMPENDQPEDMASAVREPEEPQDFRGGRSPRPNDAFIAVMGVTGSGKSSFISLCSGKAVRIGHTLEACTAIVDVYAYDMSPDQTVYLIDTPGFDDTNKSDTEVLSEIAVWLGSSYKSKILLSGIIYLHRITDVRMQGSAKKNLLMFKQLCGQDALKQVILVTTMWDRVSREEGTRREEELINTSEFWGWMVSKGSSVRRHGHNESSAKELVHQLIGHSNCITTDLQKQLIDENLTLDQTSAGRELQSELRKEQEKWAKRLAEVEEQMRAAIQQRDQEAEEALKEVRDEYTVKIQQVEKDTVALRFNMESLISQRDIRLGKMQQKMYDEQNAHTEQIKEMREQMNNLQNRLSTEYIHTEMEQHHNKLKPWHCRKGKLAFSISMAGVYYTCISPVITRCNEGPGQTPAAGFRQLRSVFLGKKCGESPTWLARYSDGVETSDNLKVEYPQLQEALTTHGVDHLKACTLGPNQTYYARFKSSWSSNVPDNLKNTLKIYDPKKRDAARIVTVALGYDGAYVIAYRNGRGVKPSRGFTYGLKGHYQALKEILSKKKNLKIVAVTLNPENATDFIIIWEEKASKGKSYRMQCYSQYQTVIKEVETWWNWR